MLFECCEWKHVIKIMNGYHRKVEKLKNTRRAFGSEKLEKKLFQNDRVWGEKNCEIVESTPICFTSSVFSSKYGFLRTKLFQQISEIRKTARGTLFFSFQNDKTFEDIHEFKE